MLMEWNRADAPKAKVAHAFLLLVMLLACEPFTLTASRSVVELHIDGEIEPVMAEYINHGIDNANREGAALILIDIDTPGGLDESMRAIIQHILDSAAPVVVYVTPAGSRAASA